MNTYNLDDNIRRNNIVKRDIDNFLLLLFVIKLLGEARQKKMFQGDKKPKCRKLLSFSSIDTFRGGKNVMRRYKLFSLTISIFGDTGI